MRLIDARKLKKSAKFVRIDGVLKAVVLYSDIMNAPTVDAAAVMHGEWIGVRNGKGICSRCNRLDSIDPLATHCRYCGADMREGEGNDA